MEDTVEEKIYEAESPPCSPHARVVVSVRPTGLFRCSAVELVPSASTFLVHSIRVGRTEQLKFGGVPAEVFAPGAVRPGMVKLDVCYAEMDLSVELENVGEETATVKAKFSGPQLTETGRVPFGGSSTELDEASTELDVLEEITRGGLPSHMHAEIATCGAAYTVKGYTFPERCQLEADHPRRSTASNHYHGNIGWWA